MIRIQRVLYKISLILIFGFLSIPSLGQFKMGAQGLAMGNATTAFPGYSWALFSNPALISNEEIAIGFYGLRNYGFTELTDMSALGTIPTKFGTVALGLHRYGDNLFNETRVRFGYKNQWRTLHYGIVLNYNNISFGANYGSGNAVGIDAGLAAEITSRLWFGASGVNINRPEYDGIEEELARELAVGLSYQLNELALFNFDVVKDVRYPVSYRGGIEVNVIEKLQGRVGITSYPLTYSMGFGYEQKRWEANIAVQKHELLGLSPGLDFVIFMP
jgi:hypothetical protein